MKKIIRKARAALGLYQPLTLLTKLHELYVINPARFYGTGEKPIAGPAPAAEYCRPPSTEYYEAAGRPRTIYFLLHCFYPFSQGGTERFVYNMARQAQKDGHRVKVVTYNALDNRGHFSRRVAGILYGEYQVDGLDVIEYRHRRAPRGILHDILTEDPDVDAFARYLFERERPDMVHAAYLQKVSSFLGACQRQGVPYGITFTSFFCLCHFDIMIDRKGTLCQGSEGGERCRQSCTCLEIPDMAARRRRMEGMLAGAAFLAAPSQFVRRMISGEFTSQPIRVINHGVSRQFSDVGGRAGPKPDRIRDFAYFGNITPIKGVHVLINAFRGMPDDCSLNIYGTGPEVYLRRLRRLMRGQDNIKLHGSIPYNQMQQAYGDNQAIVVPSIWYETYNFVIHEAALMGKLVIAARIGAMPELIRHGINGLSFTPGDSQDLRRCLQMAIAPGFQLPSPAGPGINTVTGEWRCYHGIYESWLEKQGQ